MSMSSSPSPPTSYTVDLPVPDRALAISAHPDDSELQAGGTLAKWAAAGSEVFIVVCTDGSKGTWNPDQNLAELIATRQAEQRSAAEALGASTEVGFCGWVDGELESGLAQRGVIARWIRHFRPNVVIGHDPWKRYRLHPDHRHAGLLTVEGIVASRDPHFFPEHGLPHHRPDALLLFEADEPDHVEDVTSFEDVKLDSLERHVSQLESTMSISEHDDGSERIAFHQRVRATLQEHGALVDVTSGERFKLITKL